MKNIKFFIVTSLLLVMNTAVFAEKSRYGTDFSENSAEEIVAMLKMSPESTMELLGVDYCNSLEEMQQKLSNPADRLQYHILLNGLMGNYAGLLFELIEKKPQHLEDLGMLLKIADSSLVAQAPYDEAAKDDASTFKLSAQEVYDYQRGLDQLHSIIVGALNELVPANDEL